MIFALETSQSSRLFSISDQKKVRSSRITFEKDLLRQSFGVVVGIRFIQKLGTHEYEFSVSLPFFLPNPVMEYFVEPNRRAVSDQNLIFSRQRNRHSNHLSAFSVKNLVPKLSAQVEVNAFSLSSLLNSDKQQTPTRSERLASSN